MHKFAIDPDYIPDGRLDTITEICWDAREILGGYMDEGYEFDASDEDDEFEPGSIEIEDEDGISKPTVHETPTVPINSRQHVCLSNVVFFKDTKGKLDASTEPGFVAARFEPIGNDPNERRIDTDIDSHQIIFRLPNPSGESAAIFDGYRMDNCSLISGKMGEELQVIRALLTAVRFSLRVQLMQDGQDYSQAHLAVTPQRPMGDQIENWLANQFEL